MIRTLLAAAALLLLPGTASAQKMCDQWKSNTTTSPSPLTEKVAGVPNQRIYICGYVLMRGTGSDLQFELIAGTGTNCANNKSTIIPRMALPVNGILVNRTPYATGEMTPPGHAICLQTYGTGALGSIFYYAQF